MSTAVTLTVMDGSCEGEKFLFSGPRSCMIGRARDCDLKVPSTEFDWTISRHHCQLGIEADGVWVRDLGSLNGTYLNGIKIGQRHPLVDPVETDPIELPQYSVATGDRLQLGDLKFQIGIQSDTDSDSLFQEQHLACECGAAL